MLHQLLAESAGNFWWPAELENVANPDFENLRHLQNPGRLPLNKASIVSALTTGQLPNVPRINSVK